MLKEYDVKEDVIKLYCKDLNKIKYFIQHRWNKNSDSHNHLIRNLVEGRVVTLELVDTKEQLTIMFTKALYANQSKNISSGLGTFTIEEL